MQKSRPLRLALMTSAVLSLPLMVLPHAAMAQSEPASTTQATSIDDIVVTARRREESLKD